MMPLSLFASRSFSGANALTFFLYFSLSAILFFLPMAAISGWGESAAAISWVFVPIAVFLTLMSGPAGKLADRFGPAPLITLGASLVAAAFAGLALTAHRQDLWFEALPLMTLMGFGMGFVVSPLSTAVMTSVEDEETGVASGINNAISRVAGLVAVAALGGLAALVFGLQVSDTAAAGAGVSFGAVPDAGSVSEAAEAARVAASNAAFSAVAWVTAALAGLSAIIAWMTLEWRSGTPAQAEA
jgi:MFS family permease